MRPCSSTDRAHPSYGGGCGFESRQGHEPVCPLSWATLKVYGTVIRLFHRLWTGDLRGETQPILGVRPWSGRQLTRLTSNDEFRRSLLAAALHRAEVPAVLADTVGNPAGEAAADRG
jgi:hypothetical protein